MAYVIPGFPYTRCERLQRWPGVWALPCLDLCSCAHERSQFDRKFAWAWLLRSHRLKTRRTQSSLSNTMPKVSPTRATSASARQSDRLTRSNAPPKAPPKMLRGRKIGKYFYFYGALLPKGYSWEDPFQITFREVPKAEYHPLSFGRHGPSLPPPPPPPRRGSASRKPAGTASTAVDWVFQPAPTAVDWALYCLFQPVLCAVRFASSRRGATRGLRPDPSRMLDGDSTLWLTDNKAALRTQCIEMTIRIQRFIPARRNSAITGKGWWSTIRCDSAIPVHKDGGKILLRYMGVSELPGVEEHKASLA
ncbi:hypothetical protein B0H19DRAFT_1085942 [Mycena capillaripes]|nr:hypothetical protein B0H19DRAFT_1085942 [Mycena capillaripes]